MYAIKYRVRAASSKERVGWVFVDLNTNQEIPVQYENAISAAKNGNVYDAYVVNKDGKEQLALKNGKLQEIPEIQEKEFYDIQRRSNAYQLRESTQEDKLEVCTIYYCQVDYYRNNIVVKQRSNESGIYQSRVVGYDLVSLQGDIRIGKHIIRDHIKTYVQIDNMVNLLTKFNGECVNFSKSDDIQDRELIIKNLDAVDKILVGYLDLDNRCYFWDSQLSYHYSIFNQERTLEIWVQGRKGSKTFGALAQQSILIDKIELKDNVKALVHKYADSKVEMALWIDDAKKKKKRVQGSKVTDEKVNATTNEYQQLKNIKQTKQSINNSIAKHGIKGILSAFKRK